jgi:hypothetical protein
MCLDRDTDMGWSSGIVGTIALFNRTEGFYSTVLLTCVVDLKCLKDHRMSSSTIFVRGY